MSVRGSSPTRAGIDLFPAVCFLVPGSIVVAALTTRLGRFRWAIWLGWSVTTLACGLFIIFDIHTKLVVIAVALAVFGIGSGMVLTSVNVGIQAISKVEDSAMAASMYGFFRSLGMPIGVAVSLLFQTILSVNILTISSYLGPSSRTQCPASCQHWACPLRLPMTLSNTCLSFEPWQTAQRRLQFSNPIRMV